ncbi:MAG: amidohydrolase family protein, partial [Pseudomonadota bacterium]|nr:amidohydrolase family protein [Pseudomonadota bacterium]
DVTSFTVSAERITLENGRLTSGEGRLAGAHLGLDRAVRVMIDQAGVDVADALHMASGVPAAILGLTDQFGSVAVGRSASLTCLNGDFEAEAVVVAGTLFRNEGGNGGG